MRKIFDFLVDYFDVIIAICFALFFGLAVCCILHEHFTSDYASVANDFDFLEVSNVGVASNAYDSEVRVMYVCFKCIDGEYKQVGYERYIVVPDYCYLVYSPGMRFDSVADLKAYARTVLNPSDFVEVSHD